MKKQIIRETKYDDYDEITRTNKIMRIKAVVYKTNIQENIKDTNILIGKRYTPKSRIIFICRRR